MAFNPVSLVSATTADGTFSVLGATVHNAGVTSILTGNAGRFLLEGAGPVAGDDAGATFAGSGATFVATLNGLTVTAAPTFSALTQFRIPVAGAAGLLGDFAGLTWGPTAGQGLTIAAGTATTNVQALSATQTWNNAAVAFTAHKMVITDTASAAGSLAVQILGGAAGTTLLMSLGKLPGVVTIGNLTYDNADLKFYNSISDTTNSVGIASSVGGGPSAFRVRSAGLFSWSSDTTQYGVQDTAFSRISAGLIGVGTGAAGSIAGSLSMAAATLSGTLTLTPAISMLSTGAAPTVGELVLVAGTKTVNTTAATSTCKVFAQRKTAGGTVGFASTYTINAGVSFTLNSDNVLDTSTYEWWIVEAR